MKRAGAVLALLLLVGVGAVAKELRCDICGRDVEHGYRVPDGRFVCDTDLERILPRCSVCSRSLQGRYKIIGSDEFPVCDACYASYPHCAVCALPVKDHGRKLRDGRVLCAEHRRSGVFTEGQARRIFQQGERDVLATFGSGLRLSVAVGVVKLVDSEQMARLASESTAERDGRPPLGLTSIQKVEAGQKSYFKKPVIYLTSGLPEERLLTIAIHEYAHAWHSQNHPRYSDATRRFREGFAEWVAYKVSNQMGRLDEARALHDKPDPDYSQGLAAFLRLEKERGVDGVFHYATSQMQI